jgi:hypothetical protein
MKRLMLAVGAMLAATLLTGNAFALTLSPAKGLHAPDSTVMVHHCRHAHGCRHSACAGCGGCGCAACGPRVFTYSTRCTACGTCGGGGCCGAGGGCGYYGPAYYGPYPGCGCGGYYGGGWNVFGWLY